MLDEDQGPADSDLTRSINQKLGRLSILYCWNYFRQVGVRLLSMVVPSGEHM